MSKRVGISDHKRLLQLGLKREFYGVKWTRFAVTPCPQQCWCCPRVLREASSFSSRWVPATTTVIAESFARVEIVVQETRDWDWCAQDERWSHMRLAPTIWVHAQDERTRWADMRLVPTRWVRAQDERTIWPGMRLVPTRWVCAQDHARDDRSTHKMGSRDWLLVGSKILTAGWQQEIGC